jgi:ABC-type amino acid transport system permease subunit
MSELRQHVLMVTTHIIHTPVRPMDTTDRNGSRAAYLLARARGITAITGPDTATMVAAGMVTTDAPDMATMVVDITGRVRIRTEVAGLVIATAMRAAQWEAFMVGAGAGEQPHYSAEKADSIGCRPFVCLAESFLNPL